MCGIAINRLGLTAWDYYKLTPREFYNALEDYAEQKQFENRLPFEAARLVCATVWNAAGNKLQRPIQDVAAYMPFPWDKEQKTRQGQSVEEMKQIMMGIATRQNKKVEKEKKKRNKPK